MPANKIHYLKKQVDEMLILGFFIDLSLAKITSLSNDEQLILAALKRASQQFEHTSLQEAGAILANYEAAQITGLVNNVKGIAHEMQFVQLENADGDSIYATMYKDSNHPKYDIILTDSHTGIQTQIQLKATDDKSYVNEWLTNTEHQRADIYVTDELATKMHLPSSGVNNQALTENVEVFIDDLIARDATMLDTMPILSVANVSMVVYQLWQRYQNKEISYQKFKHLVKLAVGKKALKVGTISALLSIPGLNYAIATAMLSNLIYKLRK